MSVCVRHSQTNTNVLFWNFDAHFEHLLKKLLLFAAHCTAVVIKASQQRLLLHTTSVETSFANRTDEYFKLDSQVTTNL